ncbi:cysteine desulfurase family protein [Caulobacter sp. 602-1]|uniref:cysteine desulfurase family protein n=1 Tax=Caulobacter sp. 602-1 TaxID=2492472 RepID=UPI0013155DD2|nr:cysteine desulfurase family protein [Caulobacter sp. 602-1]
MNRIVYLDGHATTPLADEAADAMAPYWTARAGNAQSPHARGQAVAAAIELAREEVARLIGAQPQEIVFTSGATEANNLAILGVAEAARRSGSGRNKVIASAIEHKSVLAALEELANRGFEVALAPVTTDGVVDLAALEALVDERTLLVSLMGANNEVGTIQPLAQAARLVHAKGAMIHSDLAQLAGKSPVDVAALDLDYASLSAHKLYGPMGVGALFVSGLADLKPRPLVFGGGQERGLRPGTLPAPLLVGFGAASAVATRDMAEVSQRQQVLATELLAGLAARQVRLHQNAIDAPRLPGSLSLRFPSVDADEVVGRLASTICLSTGSACSAGQITVSHVLKAMSMSDGQARSVIRVYIDRYTTLDDIHFAAGEIATAVMGVSGCHWVSDPVGCAHEVHTH